MSASFESLVRHVSPAVVEILVTGYGSDEEDDQDDRGGSPPPSVGRERSLGSGVIIDPDGYIVTNNHVIKGADRVRVVLTPAAVDESQPATVLQAKRRILPAKIIGVSKVIDLAVLKIEATGLPTLPFARYDRLHKGQIVLAFGSPEGLENSVTFGVISSVLRQPDPDDPMVYIQTDAAINPGNSGGPLVDADGNIVGIDTFIYTKSGGNEGIGFAIPSGIVRYAYEQIRQYGRVRRRTIGADLQTLSPDMAAGLGFGDLTGVIVSDLEPDGPAETAGLHVQDLIQSIDGMPCENVALFTLSLYLRTTNDKVNLQIMRGTKPLTVTVPVIEPRHDVSRLAELSDPSKDLIPRLGILGATITPQVGEILGGTRRLSGVLVTATVANRLAVDSGLQEGDIIHSLNRTQIKSMDDLRTTFTQLKPGDPAVMQVERAGRLTYLTFEME
ncbi:MAG TPA: trypsin-like peptidase domain-containing protein [Dongiaceae bacterium]|nr:trypsin-like peptidase domain-containing protein [Dongiaceae bacterium]